MEMSDPRGWVFYYLISFVALLWVGFLFTQGVMLWVGMFLAITVLGFSLILFIMLIIDIRNEKKVLKEGAASQKKIMDESLH
jgi:ABC-type bacteriocin/lantibiotic exporter with double-glycine peptidase domain